MSRTRVGRFGSVLTAMITPFDDEGRLDVDEAIKLAKWLGENGSDGLVLAGTTGEAPVLTDDEVIELWSAVCGAVTIPVVAGTGTNDTAHSIELTKRAESCGAAGILLVTPYYSRPSQAGIENNFTAIASATTLPVVLYDVPARTGRKISHDVIVRLAQAGTNIVGIKDAAGDIGATTELLAAVPESFDHYSGDDSLTLPFLSLGCNGVVSVASHWAGAVFQRMVAAGLAGRVDEARDANIKLLPSYAYETSDADPYPIPAKAMMRTLGFAAGHARPPHGPDSPDLEDRARAVLAGLGDDAPPPAPATTA